MAGNRAGGLRAAKTNKERHGEDYYTRIGRKGGLRSTPTGGFGSDRWLAKRAGQKGGRISRRGPGKKNIEAYNAWKRERELEKSVE